MKSSAIVENGLTEGCGVIGWIGGRLGCIIILLS